CQQYSTLPWTF
nr:immunoglobulin light chain junction region [Macaca mulatta]MOV81095.1 immunoglobulin light chain junction region [Macaca mulatta]MOV83269.1 immunoglobulin light chain junction region [Macaca mulatta]MOW09165.1 immunoglobulin light chain junction region [Macaca mulatta]MOW09628.1 immunoglobulin light chain junction region [Macaca mulatta]